MRATFWQDQVPYVTNVVAVWEPEHMLSVLDLSGTPSQYESSD